MGVDILAFDKYPPESDTVEKDRRYGFEHTWTEVLQGDERVASWYPERALLLIWPSYDNGWADRALRRYRGRTLIYIGEGYGGCTGDDAFHDRLERAWHAVAEAAVYQHDGIHDRCWVYQRAAEAEEA